MTAARSECVQPIGTSRSAAQNGTLHVAYLIPALRALGLDAGPITGFDPARVDDEFFPEGKIKSNVLINIGYGVDAKLFPRSPRFPNGTDPLKPVERPRGVGHADAEAIGRGAK